MRKKDHAFEFVHVDVFARRPLEGNPLAVFTDASGLTSGQMQSIAREMNLSETTFVFPRSKAIERVQGVKTRIFTVKEELAFAGHPTLGTAWVLRRGAKKVALGLKIGRISVDFSTRHGRAFGEMTQRDPSWGMEHEAQRVARSIGVEVSDLDPRATIETVSTGNPFVIVPFRSLGRLQTLKPETGRMEEYLAFTDAKFFYFVCRETVNPSSGAHARMMFYGGEDPATGSAAGPAVAWMLRHGWVRGEESVWIEQGYEIQRPSQIFAIAGGTRDSPRSIRVGGFCAGLIEGKLSLLS